MDEQQLLALIQSFKGLAKDKIASAIKKFHKKYGAQYSMELKETHLKVWLNHKVSVVDGKPTEESQLATVGYTLVKNTNELTIVKDVPFPEISGIKYDIANIHAKSDLVIKYILSKIMAENGLDPKESYGIMLLHPVSEKLLVAAVHNVEGSKKVYTFSSIFE